MEPRAWMRGEKGLQALEWITRALGALALLAALAFGLRRTEAGPGEALSAAVSAWFRCLIGQGDCPLMAVRIEKAGPCWTQPVECLARWGDCLLQGACEGADPKDLLGLLPWLAVVGIPAGGVVFALLPPWARRRRWAWPRLPLPPSRAPRGRRALPPPPSRPLPPPERPPTPPPPRPVPRPTATPDPSSPSGPTPAPRPKPTPPRTPTPAERASEAPAPAPHPAGSAGSGALPTAPLTFRNLSWEELLRFQQDQGNTNYCASYAISTALNLLFRDSRLTSGLDIVKAIQAHQIPPSNYLFPILFGLQLLRKRPYPYYSLLPDGAAVPPVYQLRILRELVPQVLRQRGLPASIRVQARRLTPPQLIDALRDPNQVVLFTYFIEPGNLGSGHVMVLVAYDPEKGFGFLNSGAERPDPDQLPKHEKNDPKARLTWKRPEEIERLMKHWTNFFIYPNFVIISLR
jgi:hypothetical protein